MPEESDRTRIAGACFPGWINPQGSAGLLPCNRKVGKDLYYFWHGRPGAV